MKPTICLSMIMKNEAHIILETLESIYKFIDYYVINDTGSTDNSIQIVKDFFDNKKIPGEIIEHEFRTCKCHKDIYKKYDFFHFGWNRTYALMACYNKSDYIFVMDADDIIVGDFKLPPIMNKDAYKLRIGNDFVYNRIQIFKNNTLYGWEYKEPLHEYLTCKKPNFSEELIEGNYYLDSRRLGDRSKDPNKYIRDAKVFEIMLQEHPNNDRYMFYLAQSYMDGGDHKKAIYWYEKRIQLKGWQDEVFYSYLKIAECMFALKEPWADVQKAFLKAYNYSKIRVEPLYEIAKYYDSIKDFESCYIYAKSAASLTFPGMNVLFINKSLYDYKAKDQCALAAYYTNRYIEAAQLWQSLINSPNLPQFEHERIKTNLKFANDKIKEHERQFVCIYVGNIFFDKNNQLFKLITDMCKYYKVFIFGNHINNQDITDAVVCDINNAKIICKTQKFDLLILFDNFNIFYDKFTINATKTVLIQTNNIFKVMTNNTTVIIYDIELLNKYLKNVNSIYCLHKLDFSDYSIDNNSILLIDINKPHMFFDKNDISYHAKSENLFGIEYIIPDCIQYLMKNNLDYSYQILTAFFNDNIKYLSYPQSYVYLIEYLHAIGHYDDATNNIEYIYNLIGTNYPILKNILLYWKAKCLTGKRKHEQAFNILSSLINNDLPNQVLKDIIIARDQLIDKIKDSKLIYPKNSIIDIVNNIKTKKQRNIVFSITTCKRYDLFEKTMNSFINSCQDIHLIDYWLCIDDNSSDFDRQKMIENYPFMNFKNKSPSEKGHYISMNIIRDFVINNGTQYLLHIEDDWHFIESKKYISDAINILKLNNKYGQVLFNINYAEIPRNESFIYGGIIKKSQYGRFVEHEYYPTDSIDYQLFLNRNKNKATCAYWPHYSFRPSLINTEIFKQIGRFYNTPHFEMAYAHEYYEAGFISVFFDTFSCIHIGKKTWETGKNSYDLNNVNQFTSDSALLMTYVLNEHKGIFKEFKESARSIVPQYIRKNISNITTLSEELQIFYNDNTFQYDRRIISFIETFLNIIRDSQSDILIIRDGIMFSSDATFNKLKDYIMEDIVVFGKNIDNFSIFNENIYAFLITKDACSKIRNELSNIQTSSDLFNKCSLLIHVSESNIFTKMQLSNTPKDNPIEIPGFEFYPELDSFGNDINYFENKTPNELANICKEHNGAGFNTSGWIKSIICDRKNMILLFNSKSINEGLYVKIQ